MPLCHYCVNMHQLLTQKRENEKQIEAHLSQFIF